MPYRLHSSESVPSAQPLSVHIRPDRQAHPFGGFGVEHYTHLYILTPAPTMEFTPLSPIRFPYCLSLFHPTVDSLKTKAKVGCAFGSDRHTGESRNPELSNSRQRNHSRKPWIPAKAGMTVAAL